MEKEKSAQLKEKADAIGGAVFFIGLGILLLTGWWWPGIIVVIGVSSVVTSLLAGKIRDALIAVVIFGIVIGLSLANIPITIVIALLVIGVGIWIFIHAFQK